jgi:3-phosphoshikimate 1-carboxyvinyltransferase
MSPAPPSLEKVEVIECGTDSVRGDTKFADTLGLMRARVEEGKNDVTMMEPGGTV